MGTDDHLLWDDQLWEFPKLDVEAPPPAGKKRSAGEEGGGGGDDHELHIWTERERRKKMRNMFANLHALLPHIPPKADKSTIVDEAVKHIKKLQQTVEELEKRKLEIRRVQGYEYPITRDSAANQSREAFMADQGSTTVTLASPTPLQYFPIFKTWTSSNVVLNVCGKDAHISICTPKKPGLLTLICFLIQKHNLEIVSAQLSSHRTTCMYMINTRANGGSDHPLQQALVEEIYKQAAAELMLWVNSC